VTGSQGAQGERGEEDRRGDRRQNQKKARQRLTSESKSKISFTLLYERLDHPLDKSSADQTETNQKGEGSKKELASKAGKSYKKFSSLYAFGFFNINRLGNFRRFTLLSMRSDFSN
jgi:hypothetical protein